MRNTFFSTHLPLLLLLLIVSASSSCSICSKCTNCGPDVLNDDYINEIDSLMQAKVKDLGYPLTITRNYTSSTIIYDIQYSSGLQVALQLTLANMQIQLLSYSINNGPSAVTATASSPTTSSASSGSASSTTTSSSTSSSSSSSFSSSSSSEQVISYKKTEDGYFIIPDVAKSKEVNHIMAYLTSLLKDNLTNFQLTAA